VKQKSRWLKSHQYPTTNLAEVRSSQNLTRIPNVNLGKILAEKQIPGGQNLSAILPGISPILMAGSEILGEIHCGNLGKILDMLPQISFGAIVF